MATKKTKETKTTKTKKVNTKAKTTKKETVKEEPEVVENVEVKEEEPVVVEKVVENTVESVTVDVTIDSVEKLSDIKEIEDALKNDEIPNNVVPEPTEEQIAEMQKVADEDDAKLEYAQSMLEKIQEVTQQEEPDKADDVEEEPAQMESTEEYYIPVDENGSNTVSNETTATTETTVVNEPIEKPEQNEEKPKRKRRFGFMYRWFGAQIDL